MPDTTKIIPPCPECGRNDFKGMQGRAIHRRWEHGVKGSTVNTIAYHKKRKEQEREQTKAKYKTNPHAIVKVHRKMNGAIQHEERQISQDHHYERQVENHVSYVFGLISSKIESYAASVGVSYSEIAPRVGELLLYSTGRKILGTEHRMSSLRRKAT